MGYCQPYQDHEIANGCGKGCLRVSLSFFYPQSTQPMTNRNSSLIFRLLLLVIAAGSTWAIVSQTDVQEEAQIEALAEENTSDEEGCMNCHGQSHYYYYNEVMDDSVRKKMCVDFRIDPEIYATSVHGSFRCTDCHSEDYKVYPHAAELRFEPQYECLDCHGGDETYADFHFETIDVEFQGSVHSPEKGFSCWNCHDPHGYQLTFRTGESVLNSITYNNSICLNCHGNLDNYQLISDKENPNLIEKHSWLPNQRAHFAKVRCIECHTQVNDEIMVAHNILPGKNAVKECVECHSTNSRLLASLYRHEQKEQRTNLGFFNGVLLENSYVIGANRNYFLNVASIVLFGLVALIILLHIGLRIYFRK